MSCLPDTDQVTLAMFVTLLWLNWQCSTLDNFLRIKKLNLAISQILISLSCHPCMTESMFGTLHLLILCFAHFFRNFKRNKKASEPHSVGVVQYQLHQSSSLDGEGQQWTNSIFARRFTYIQCTYLRQTKVTLGRLKCINCKHTCMVSEMTRFS